MSVGNVSQAVNFTDNDLVLVLGENLDLGGNDSRNGVGKSTLVNALTYALYGESLVKIKKDNLVNKINTKGMVVTLEFEKDGVAYTIKRGRKPNIFQFLVNGHNVVLNDTNESQGDSRLTQIEVERTVGISRDMFKQIVALNTYNEPFLALRANDQRAIIEQLLGITKLSEKAEVLKIQLKESKDGIKEEEFRIKASAEANKKIEGNIKSLTLKGKAWDERKKKQTREYNESIALLNSIDIDDELIRHRKSQHQIERNNSHKQLTTSSVSYEKEIKRYTKIIKLAEKHIETTTTKICPTCEQEIDTKTHARVHAEYTQQMNDAQDKLDEYQSNLNSVTVELDKVVVTDVVETFYSSIEDAYKHQSTLLELENNLNREEKSANPYLDQIETLETEGTTVIDYARINELSNMRDHQEFLLKLLINKDSFIRKKIIEQNLLYLNSRLSHYLIKLGLPHTVKFMSDLEVEINELGRDYDFDNLSRGERTRLILSLSWAFRDVYESLTDKINLLFIDELLDSGLDSSGTEGALAVLKGMTREQNRNIFLISHKDELIGRVSSVLRVVKEGGFTSFDNTDTNLI